MKRAFLALALAVSCLPVLPVTAEGFADARISRFSGKPVPRFESLRHARVNGRKGPSADYPIEWEYAQQGLPVLILKESGDWYFVRDPMGDEVWIKATQLSPARTAVTTQAFTLKAGRAADSAGIAEIGASVVVDMDSCDADLCQVQAGKYRGWAPRGQLWGAGATGG